MKKVAGYPNYDSSEFHSPATLDELDDAQLESIWKRQYALQPLIAPDQFKSYEDLKKRLDAVLNLKSSGSSAPSTPAVTAESVVSAKPAFSSPAAAASNVEETPSTPVASSDDKGEEEDDVLDYFRKLADEWRDGRVTSPFYL